MILLPKGMPIEAIHENAAKMIENYFPQRMERIIELIQRANFATLRKGKDKPLKKRPYVYSRDLNNICSNYKDYINVLFHAEMLIIDDDYSHKGIDAEKDPFTKAYYFTPIYGKKLFYLKTVYDQKSILFSNNDLLYYSSVYLNNILLFKLNRFFAFLSFNPEDILADLDDELEQSCGKTIVNKDKKVKKAFLKYNSAVYLTHSLASRSFHFFRNYTNHRLYGPLTSFPKRLRKHFTLRGEKLVSIDLSNAQPFLSLVLFDKAFWKGDDCTSPLRLNIDTIGMKQYFKDTIYNYICENNFQSLEKYRSFVLSDGLYNHLINEYDIAHLDYKKAKKRTKKSMYTIMFSKAKSGYAISPGSKRAKFISAFPDIYGFWAQIKDDQNQNHPIILNPNSEKEQESHSLLSVMLQRVEAFLFLDIIVPHILTNYPNVPLIPIHDCLVTTEQHAQLVEQIIRRYITEYTGYTPHLKSEAW